MCLKERHACGGRLHYEPLPNVLASVFSSGIPGSGSNFTKIFHRAKELYDQFYQFKHKPTHFLSFFEGKPTLDDYLKLDESVVLYYFQVWQEEDDPILKDLCYRFLNRHLFKYIEFDPAKQYKTYIELVPLFEKAGINPDYYLVLDSSSDLPYDFYRPGEEGEHLPIQLLMPNGEIRELSRESEIVEAISGKRRTDHKLYFPADFLRDESTHGNVKAEIRKILGLRTY